MTTAFTISRHVTDLLPYIGSLPMQDVCNDALEAFKLDRLDEGVKHATTTAVWKSCARR